ncbi:MAG: hemolysin, partial [Bacteroidales bacterium]|nr:hemolysin [Bacteroidales bacterium]
MKDIIAPVDKKLLIKELTPDKFIRKTNWLNNDLFVVTAHDSPNTMREIGRLRELSFRYAGGGTGEETD